MGSDFHTQHDWRTLALAFVVWSAHFMAVWAVSIIFPAQALARWLALPLTVLAFAALAWLWMRQKDRSIRSASGLGIAIAAVATGFDALPALIG